MIRAGGAWRAVLVVLWAVLGGAGVGHAQPCEPGWSEGLFCRAGFDLGADMAVVYDDGSGPALYVVGGPGRAGCSVIDRLARWDGVAWSAPPALTEGAPGPHIRAMVVFDDGDGEKIYAAGEFETAGGQPAGGFARWDGASWEPVPGGGVDERIDALAVFDDGSGPAIFAGGVFRDAGGQRANSIARWDSDGWSVLGDPATPSEVGVGFASLQGQVYALFVHDDGRGPALFVGGRFDRAGATDASGIARWDGTTWSTLGESGVQGVLGNVFALEAFDDGPGPVLYVGGGFGHAGGQPVENLARWDGQAWSSVGTIDPDERVTALRAYDDGSGPKLYATGVFLAVDGMRVGRIARWDGVRWTPLDGAIGDGVWGSGSTYGSKLTLANLDGQDVLVLTGSFEFAGGLEAGHIAVWGPDGWSVMREGGLPPTTATTSWVSYDDGSGPALYASGRLPISVGREDIIARWTGSDWLPLEGPGGQSLSEGDVSGMLVSDDGRGPALFVAGSFATADGIVVNSVARWDGANWSGLEGPFTPGVDRRVNDIEVFDDGRGEALYVSGLFLEAGGVPSRLVARWDGATWSPLLDASGLGLFGDRGRAMAVFDDGRGAALYVAGDIRTAGGQDVSNVARWDGSTWEPLAGPMGEGLDDTVFDLAVFDDGHGTALYAAGRFDHAGGREIYVIAKWDGSDWYSLEGPMTGTGLSGSLAEALAVFDDGHGPALYVAGDFSQADNQPTPHIARWDGENWSAVGGDGPGPSAAGIDGTVNFLSVAVDGGVQTMFAGGNFQFAGGYHSWRTARYARQPSSCVADLNCDGELTLFDFLAFQNAFDAGNPIADFDGDGEFTIFDFLAFQNAFDAGCL